MLLNNSSEEVATVSKQLLFHGMKLDVKDTHGSWVSAAGDTIFAVYPNETSLPHYARDAEIFVGTLKDLRLWLSGINWLISYYELLGLNPIFERQRKEKEESQKQLMYSLFHGSAPKLKK